MRNKLLLATALLCAVIPQAQATLDFYDSFNYSPTGIALTNAATGIWVPRTGALNTGVTNNAGSLSYPGLQTATGDNSVLFQGSGASGIVGRNLSTIYNSNNVTTLYYSLTFKVTSISLADWGGAANQLTGSFMLGFDQKARNGTAQAQGDAAAPLLIRTGDPSNNTGTNNDFQGYQLGIGVTAISPSSRIFDSTHVYNAGDTLFLVGSYTFGVGASNDVARLYVNPTPGSAEGANTPAVIAAGVTNVINNQIQSFFLRNNSVEPAFTVIDDLRVGTTWEDVTPIIPEPSAPVLGAIGLFGMMVIRRFRR